MVPNHPQVFGGQILRDRVRMSQAGSDIARKAMERKHPSLRGLP